MNKVVRNTSHHHKRMKAECRFHWYGRVAMGVAVLLLVLLVGSIGLRGLGGFIQPQIKLSVVLDESLLSMDAGETPFDLSPARFNLVWQKALEMQAPQPLDPAHKRLIARLIGGNAAGVQIKKLLEQNPQAMGQTIELWFPASKLVKLWQEGDMSEVDATQQALLETLHKQGAIRTQFNTSFFTHSDSRSPENAGFLGAMVGSFFTLAACLAAAFPLGVMSAIYLEEFARKGRFVDLLEVNINNLAAVPSIVFGLLGLSVYIGVMHLPRSAPIVGGLTLALMVLPVIIISTRSALKSVPPSIRHAALALGASRLQTVWHHTLPLAMPGIMTGTILGMARAIGETAPLLMIGMVAFVADVPSGFTSAATVMPVQVFLWASSPEAGFAEKTASAILVLLVLLLGMNALAIYLRKKFEVRW